MKNAIVTGGASGIGQSIVKALIHEGYRVGIIDSNLKAIEALRTQVPLDALKIFHGDVGIQGDLDAFVAMLRGEFEHIDVLVNNACYSRGGLETCDYEAFNEVLRVGASAPFYLTQQLMDFFSEEASIINISSTRYLMSQSNTESYTAAKGAITALTHAMAVTLRGRVRVNAISPGWIDTQQGQWSDADKAQHLVERIGQPQDIANMVLYLISDKAGFITGQNFIVDGGMSKQMIYHGDEGWNREI